MSRSPLLDTGVSPSHPDLKSKLLRGRDLYNNDDDPSDDEGHGTYTAGVAAAGTDNGTGIAGICWGCKILPVKVLGSRGQGDDATIAAGIRWAVDQGVRIISMSLGGPDDTDVMRDAVAYAHDHNVLIIAASGNGQAEGNLPNYPAAYPSVLAVSATNSTDGVTGFSTTGSFVDIAAPGVGLWSTLWLRGEGDTYGVANGTSAACPHVAGAAALALSLRPDLTADQLAEVLEAGADDQGAPGKDPEYGYGRLNLLRTVQIAADPNVLSHSRIQGVVAGAQAGQVDADAQQRPANPDRRERRVSLRQFAGRRVHRQRERAGRGAGPPADLAERHAAQRRDAQLQHWPRCSQVLRAGIAAQRWRDLLPANRPYAARDISFVLGHEWRPADLRLPHQRRVCRARRGWARLHRAILRAAPAGAAPRECSGPTMCC